MCVCACHVHLSSVQAVSTTQDDMVFYRSEFRGRLAADNGDIQSRVKHVSVVNVVMHAAKRRGRTRLHRWLTTPAPRHRPHGKRHLSSHAPDGPFNHLRFSGGPMGKILDFDAGDRALIRAGKHHKVHAMRGVLAYKAWAGDTGWPSAFLVPNIVMTGVLSRPPPAAFLRSLCITDRFLGVPLKFPGTNATAILFKDNCKFNIAGITSMASAITLLRNLADALSEAEARYEPPPS